MAFPVSPRARLQALSICMVVHQQLLHGWDVLCAFDEVDFAAVNEGFGQFPGQGQRHDRLAHSQVLSQFPAQTVIDGLSDDDVHSVCDAITEFVDIKPPPLP